MKVTLTEHSCTVERTPDDPRFSTEHTFLYHVRNALRAQGQDVVKRRLSQDGHLMGDDKLPYIRARDWSFFIFFAQWQLRTMLDDWREDGSVYLTVQRNPKEARP
jgi:hypothetical protein